MPHPSSLLPSTRPWWVASLGLVLVAALATACENNRTNLTAEQSERGLGLPDTSSDGKRVKLDPRCKLDELVTDPKEGTVEHVLFQLIEAASATGDDKAAFQKFYSHFPSDTEERWVRDQYFTRAKKFVDKYLQQDISQGVAFKICERRDEGKDTVKVFIQSLDHNKSNPPITLKKDDAGVWKVIFYTP